MFFLELLLESIEFGEERSMDGRHQGREHLEQSGGEGEEKGI